MSTEKVNYINNPPRVCHLLLFEDTALKRVMVISHAPGFLESSHPNSHVQMPTQVRAIPFPYSSESLGPWFSKCI